MSFRKILLPFIAIFPFISFSQPATITNFIKTDQLGYRTGDEKVAVISDPQTGYNSALSFNPGTTYEVRDWNTNAVVFTGSPVAWNGGATQTQSGDKAWWFTFSSLTLPGEYYIFDASNNIGSGKFVIDDCVYNETLKQSLRMLYYQRCGSAKTPVCAGTAWADIACHTGNMQDTDCRLYSNTNVSTSKDLSGGWHDAGDYNKYVNFTFGTVLDLLHAYQENPTVFGDDFNIPESGNGLADILDEVKYELDWLLKMQQGNGSLLSVIGGGGASPPSSDSQQRLYGPATTSASYTGAALFAFASKVFSSAGQTAYAATLQTAAVNAWNWAVANPGITFYNAGTLAAGENETDANGLFTRHIVAAIHLYDLTGGATYKSYVENNYASANMMGWGFVYPFENEMQDALLYYSACSGITASVGNAIRNTYSGSVSVNNADNLPAYTNATDAYRAHLSNNNYTWNSNNTKSHQGIILQNMNVYGLNAVNAINYTNAALGYVNYFHGVNPNSKTYLSNMANFGAENSVTQFYHGWFENGSALWDEVGVSTYGPPPGFIPGGPNPSYALDGCCPSGCGSAANNALCTTNVTPPMGQPIQKSYKDFNDSWPVNSWTISEAGIYTNASYTRMVSKFCGAAGSCSTTSIKNEKKEISFCSVFPNPFNNELFVQFNVAAKEKVFVRLYNMEGKKVLEETKTADAGNIILLDLRTISKGMYFVEVSCGEKVERKKIVRE